MSVEDLESGGPGRNPKRPALDRTTRNLLDEILEKHGYVAVVEYIGCQAERLGSISGREFAEAISLCNYSYGEPLDDKGKDDA